jgi:hypothetical protein
MGLPASSSRRNIDLFFEQLEKTVETIRSMSISDRRMGLLLKGCRIGGGPMAHNEGGISDSLCERWGV